MPHTVEVPLPRGLVALIDADDRERVLRYMRKTR
jgi:hypothetical protein